MDTDLALAEFRQELIGELGEDVAYRIRLSPQGRPPNALPPGTLFLLGRPWNTSAI
ncbi:hypothetical protein Misp03_17190 [Microbispora sp. NBRC 16548]|nr:hypothetical protein Misp03_17190 [Microbispora sp. NBRC 16548]